MYSLYEMLKKTPVEFYEWVPSAMVLNRDREEVRNDVQAIEREFDSEISEYVEENGEDEAYEDFVSDLLEDYAQRMGYVLKKLVVKDFTRDKMHDFYFALAKIGTRPGYSSFVTLEAQGVRFVSPDDVVAAWNASHPGEEPLRNYFL